MTDENEEVRDDWRDRLPNRAYLLRIVGKVLWPVRNPRAQREAGRESARRAVRLVPADELDSDLITDALSESLAEIIAEEGPEEPVEPDTGGAGKIVTDETAHEDLAPEPDPTAAAFFDVDNTLVQGASIILLARGLAKHKFFTTSDMLDMGWKQLKFVVSGTENPEDVASGREQALGFVKGRSVAEVVALSEEVFDESMVDRIWPGTRALTQMHLDAGQQVWLVTATPVELARVIAERLGLTGALGTVAESENGVYTGRLVGDILHGPGKAHAVEALAEEEGFDLERCAAYSDSHNDVPMLSLVGNPVAINPDSKLRAHAREQGWEVKDFRTYRKAAKRAAPFALGLGAVGGGVMALRSVPAAKARSGLRKFFE